MNSEEIFLLVSFGVCLVYMLELLIMASLCLRFRAQGRLLSDKNKDGQTLVAGWTLSYTPMVYFFATEAGVEVFNMFHYAIGIAGFLYGIFLFFKSAAALNKQIENFGKEASTE